MGNNNNNHNSNTMFPKHTNNTNAYANNATTSSSPSSSQPNRPTIIDIRQNNNATTTKSSSSTGKVSPLNPLASLSNYDSNSKGNHHSSGYAYDGGESGESGDRYENISVISGQTKNTRTPTTAMEMDWRGDAKNTNSFYTNVALNDDDDFGSRGAGAFPDNNPFVVQTNPGRNVQKVTRPNKPGYDDDNEANC